MSGTVHPYYAVALAPAIAALAGIGSLELWRGRTYWAARVVLAVTVLATSVWSAVLLGRDPSWLPGLRVIVVVLGVLAAMPSARRLGGWNGGDPYPTLAQFQAMVDRGEIGYFISGGMGGMGGGRGGNSEVATWVAANYQGQTVGNATIYKLGA